MMFNGITPSSMKLVTVFTDSGISNNASGDTGTIYDEKLESLNECSCVPTTSQSMVIACE